MVKRIAIIGGGISGLVAAFYLKRAGADVTLYERSNTVGGNIKTETRDGFLYELGPNSVLATPELLDLIRDLGLTGEIARPHPAAKYRYILRNGHLQRLPSGPLSLVRTPALSASAKLRLLKEPFIRSKGGKDESVSSFFARRFGRELVNTAVDPFVSGIYAGDPEKLVMRFAFPRIYEMEKASGSVITGMLFGKKSSKRVPKGTPRSLTFRQGMQTLPRALESHIGADVRVNCGELTLSDSRKGSLTIASEMGSEDYDAVILSVPAYAAADLVRELDPKFANELSRVSYPAVSVVYTGFKADDVKEDAKGFGFLVPGSERSKILGSLWNSSVFEQRAPDGHHLFTTFVGGSRSPELCELSDDEMIKMVVNELSKIMGISGKPVFTYVKSWKKAIPQANIGYEELLSTIGRFRKKRQNVYVCSNYYGGISVGDCVRNAGETASAIMS